MKRWYWLSGLVALVVTLGIILTRFIFTASPSVPSIQVENAWARPAEANLTSSSSHDSHSMNPQAESTETTSTAVYMVIRNLGRTPDRLVEVSTDMAAKSEIHQTVRSGDIMQMQPISALEIPPQGEVRLEPGGYHIMLMGLRQSLRVGDSLTLTLNFEKSGRVEVKVTVRQP